METVQLPSMGIVEILDPYFPGPGSNTDDSGVERDQRLETVEEWTRMRSAKDEAPLRYTYSPEEWEIVPQPTCPSGKLCRGLFTHFQEFSKVEWPEEGLRFSRFPELAVELQIKIWEYAHPAPGIIDLNIQQSFSGRYCCYVATTDQHTLASRQAHLRTCHLSREVFLNHYHQIRLLNPQNLSSNCGIWLRLQPTVIYINEDYDTVMVNFNVLRSFEARGGHINLSKVQHLAFKDYGIPRSGAHRYLETNFPYLKTITHVLNHNIFSTGNVKTLRDFGFRGKMSKSPKHDFQLIEVGGQMKRCDIFWDNPESILHSDFSGIPKRVLSRYWKMKESEKKIWDAFSKNDKSISAEKWKSVKFRFCLLAREDDLNWWSSEVLYLIPRGQENKKNGDVVYYTLRPKALYQKRSPRLLFEDERDVLDHRYPPENRRVVQKHFNFFLTPRKEDLEDLYDGIPGLFGEETPEDAEVQQELVFTAKCDYDEFEQLVYIPQSNQRSSAEARSSYVYCQQYGSPNLQLREWKSINGPGE